MQRGAYFVAWTLALMSTSNSFAHSDHSHSAAKAKKSPKSSSGLSVTVGVVLTHSFGATKSTDTTANPSTGSADDHSGHQHLWLHGDEAHAEAASGDDSGDTGEPAVALDPQLTARADYLFNRSLGMGCILGYGYSSGLMDPEFGPTLKLGLGRKFSGQVDLTASYPASKASRHNFKITTVKLVMGPTYDTGRSTFGAQAIVSYAWYSKTILYEDEQTSSPSARQDDPQALAIAPADAAGGGTDAGAFGNDLASADREFSRYGVRLNVGYKLAKRWRADSSLGIAIINRQFGPSTYRSESTIAQLSYSPSMLSVFAALGASSSASSLSTPTDPSASVGVGYTFK